MYLDTTFPPDRSGRLTQFMRFVDSMNTRDIATAVDVLIAQLDARAGDPDLEEDDPAGGEITDEPHDCDGDEHDGNMSEDDFMIHANTGDMPGCPIADPGGADVNGGFERREEDDEDDGAALRAHHLDRIRRTRCKEVRHGRHLTRDRLNSPLRTVHGAQA